MPPKLPLDHCLLVVSQDTPAQAFPCPWLQPWLLVLGSEYDQGPASSPRAGLFGALRALSPAARPAGAVHRPHSQGCICSSLKHLLCIISLQHCFHMFDCPFGFAQAPLSWHSLVSCILPGTLPSWPCIYPADHSHPHINSPASMGFQCPPPSLTGTPTLKSQLLQITHCSPSVSVTARSYRLGPLNVHGLQAHCHLMVLLCAWWHASLSSHKSGSRMFSQSCDSSPSYSTLHLVLKAPSPPASQRTWRN